MKTAFKELKETYRIGFIVVANSANNAELKI